VSWLFARRRCVLRQPTPVLPSLFRGSTVLRRLVCHGLLAFNAMDVNQECWVFADCSVVLLDSLLSDIYPPPHTIFTIASLQESRVRRIC
jgi:hypothetical protein